MYRYKLDSDLVQQIQLILFVGKKIHPSPNKMNFNPKEVLIKSIINTEIECEKKNN